MPRKKHNNEAGVILVIALVAMGLFSLMLFGALSLSLLQLKLNAAKIANAQALHVADAGVNYYRWVLYHDNNDYCNGEACQPGPDYGPYGPYEYKNQSGNITGYYELYITPPAANGSTIVNVRSIGWVADHPTIKREIEVRLGIPAWSTYSTLSNSNIRFGEGTEVWGPIHSNGGIRFDGVAHNTVSSALLNYIDPEPGSNPNEFGVHTHANVGNGTYDITEVSDGSNPPNPPDKSHVFMGGRNFPAPVVSFDLLNTNINETYAMATSAGLVFDPEPAGTADPYSVAVYRGCGNNGSTCDEGFHVTLKTDNTFDIRGVTQTTADCNGGTPTLSIQNEEVTVRNYPIPANGIIFVKNRLWIDGQINGSKVSIFAFEDPITGNITDIIINNDLLYTNYDGTDSIGLTAQRDIGPGLNSEDGLRIDAALIAKEGRVGRNYYPASCSATYHKRDTITVYGSIASRKRYGFSYSCGASDQWCSGYNIRNLVYDNNLTFAPPPHFPSTGEYSFISWKEK